jgi:dolichol kinase
MFSETARQIVHMSMCVFALLLRVLTWWQAALCAVAALAFNAVVLPRAGGRTIVRPVDASRGYPLGILIYPVSVLLLILAFPTRLDIAASAWGILAVGDGAATLVGQRWGRHRLAWNPDKSVEGLLAFIVAGGAAAVFFAWWTAPAIVPRPPMTFVVAAPLLAAVAAGLVETVPIGLDDNISVPAAAGAVLWLCSLATLGAWAGHAGAVAANVVPALIVNTVAATGGWLLRTVRLSGMMVGWAIGVVVFASLGAAGWALLFLTFIVSNSGQDGCQDGDTVFTLADIPIKCLPLFKSCDPGGLRSCHQDQPLVP